MNVDDWLLLIAVLIFAGLWLAAAFNLYILK